MGGGGEETSNREKWKLLQYFIILQGLFNFFVIFIFQRQNNYHLNALGFLIIICLQILHNWNPLKCQTFGICFPYFLFTIKSQLIPLCDRNYSYVMIHFFFMIFDSMIAIDIQYVEQGTHAPNKVALGNLMFRSNIIRWGPYLQSCLWGFNMEKLNLFLISSGPTPDH